MRFKQCSNFIFAGSISLSLLLASSCAFDEHDKRAKAEIERQMMDSLFKDADKIPVMEIEEEDSLANNN
jgi:hypothetical protein